VKKALIVIDVVNGCCAKECEDEEGGVTFNKIRQMVPRLEGFIDNFRKRQLGEIVFVNLTPWTKEYLPENIQKLYEDPDINYYGSDDSFEQEFYRLKPLAADEIITKNNYDAFTNPEFEKFLRKNGVESLIITGVFTDGCVLSTICGAFARGYNLIVPRDLVATTDLPIRQELEQALLDYTIPMQYGKVINSKEIIDEQH
jgi:nicotinamidase-related amidase